MDALGCDDYNVRSLDSLAQRGLAGRAEANRLLWTWMKPTSLDSLYYRNAPQAYQAAIRNARERVDRLPLCSKDYAAWTPHETLAGNWQVLAEYAPVDASGNILATPTGISVAYGKGDPGKGKTDPGKGNDTGKGKADNDKGKGKGWTVQPTDEPGKGTGKDLSKGKDMNAPGGPITSEPLSMWNGVEWATGWWHDSYNGLWKRRH